MLLSVSYDDADRVIFSCTADADPSSNTGLLQVHAGNAVRCSLDLPSPCTAMSVSASGTVVVGTGDGAVLVFHPGDDCDYDAPQEIYRHSEQDQVDAVEISRDEDSIIATIGLNVIVISRVFPSSAVNEASTERIEIPRIPDRCKPAEAFRSIFWGDDGTVLLCEAGSRGGIVALRHGKYYCHLMGCHEGVGGRFSSRAFRFVGCGLVEQTENADAFVVLGIENWGDLALWVVDKQGKEGCALGVAKTWDIPMRGSLAASLSMHQYTEESNTISFAVAYAASSVSHSRRTQLSQSNTGWVTVFTVPILSLMSENKELEQRIVEAEGDYALTAELEKRKRKLSVLEQIDLDAFADRPEGCQLVDSLQFTAGGRLLVACKGMRDRVWPVAGSTCARIFEQSRETGVNYQSCLPYRAVLHAYPEWRKPASDVNEEGVQDVVGDTNIKAEVKLYDEDY